MKKGFKLSYNLIFIIVVVFAVLFTAIFYFPEFSLNRQFANDNSFHLGIVKSLEHQFENGGNVLDYWIPYWSGGSALFHEYQFLPHLITVLLYKVLLSAFSLSRIMHLLIYILLIFFPLIVYFSLRKIGFGKDLSSFSALFSLAISANWSFGLEYTSVVWQGFGMFTQMFGIFLMPLAIAFVYDTLKTGKKYGLSVFLLTITFLSHILFGYMAVISSFLLLLMCKNKKELWLYFKRLILTLIILAIVTSFFWIPLLMDAKYHFRSVYEPIEKFNSVGAIAALSEFFSGEMLDSGRFPVMTILCIIGLLYSAYKMIDKKNRIYRFIFFGFIFWMVLYFGKPTLNGLLKLLPLSNVIHLERFINSVHLFAIFSVGAGLKFIFDKIKSIKNLSLNKKVILSFIIIALISFPVFLQRGNYLLYSSPFKKEELEKEKKQWSDFRKITQKIKELEPGRAYCGRASNWGDKFEIGITPCYFALGMEEIEEIDFMIYSWSPINDFQQNFNEKKQAHYNLYNVKYIIAPKSEKSRWSEFARKIFESGDYLLYKVDTSGYFDLVKSDIFLKANKKTSWNYNYLWQNQSKLLENKNFITIGSKLPQFSNYKNIIVAKDKYNYKRFYKGQKSEGHIFNKDNFFNQSFYLKEDNLGSIVKSNKQNEIYTAQVNVLKDSLLLFKVNYSPNWHLLVDGKEKEKYMLSPGMIGIKVDKGVHKVQAYYAPRKIKYILLIIGLITLGLLLYKNDKKIQ